MNISVAIITLNEEDSIERTLKSVQWADEIIIVDSGSTDKTLDLARQYDVKVFVRPFDDFSSQKNFAISKCNNEWVLSIDCDEIVTDELACAIKHVLSEESDKCGYYINRINYMYGKRLNYYAQPDYKVRLFKKNSARFVQPVHEYVQCTGSTGYLKGILLHYSIENFAEHWYKAKLYSRLETSIAIEKNLLNVPYCLSGIAIRPVYRFFQSFFIMKGYKEGRVGFIISVNSALVEFLKFVEFFKTIYSKKNLVNTKSRKWSDMYNKPADNQKYLENISIHNDFLAEISKTNPKNILEIGCGSATLSIFLNKQGIEVTAVDKDSDIIKTAGQAVGNHGAEINFKLADAFNLPFSDKIFDAVFSQGVMEHFKDNEIASLIKEQLRVSKKVFFSVPNKYYNHKDFGNERLLHSKEWERILAEFDIFLSKNYYTIRLKRNLLKKLPIMYMVGIK